MAAHVSCPLCLGPVELGDGTAACADQGHEFGDEDLIREKQQQVDKALWAAIRALEDQAAAARWATARGMPRSSTDPDAQVHAERLRELLQNRAG